MRGDFEKHAQKPKNVDRKEAYYVTVIVSYQVQGVWVL